MDDLKPGLYPDMTDEEYFALPYVNNSTLSDLKRSPAHAKWKRENPQEPTPAMQTGTLWHCAVLEPEALSERYVTFPQDLKKPTSAQLSAKNPSIKTMEQIAAWQQFEAESAGKEIIKSADLTEALQVSQMVREHPAAGKLLGVGQAEVVCIWDDHETGLRCKAKFDWIGDNGIAVDLKTTQDASPAGFAKSVANYGYFRQQAFYSEGYKQATGKQLKAFVFVAVETSPPYNVASYMLDLEFISLGLDQIDELLRKYKECVSNNEWPGYDPVVVKLEAPGWLR